MKPLPAKRIRSVLRALDESLERVLAVAEQHPGPSFDQRVAFFFELDKEGGADFGGEAAAPVPVSGVPVEIDLGGGIKVAWDNSGSGYFSQRVWRTNDEED